MKRNFLKKIRETIKKMSAWELDDKRNDENKKKLRWFIRKLNLKEKSGVLQAQNPPGSKQKRRLKRRSTGVSGNSKCYL